MAPIRFRDRRRPHRWRGHLEELARGGLASARAVGQPLYTHMGSYSVAIRGGDTTDNFLAAPHMPARYQPGALPNPMTLADFYFVKADQRCPLPPPFVGSPFRYADPLW